MIDRAITGAPGYATGSGTFKTSQEDIIEKIGSGRVLDGQTESKFRADGLCMQAEV